MREPSREKPQALKLRTDIPADPLEAARQLLEEAGKRGISPKLIGGLAFRVACPSSNEGSLSRNNNDIDLVIKRKEVGKLRKLMEDFGYEYPISSNVLHPDQILYRDERNNRQVDVFVDGFEMCHKLDFRRGLEEGGPTLPITELIMTKLQIAEITDKDLKDLGAAFYDFKIGKGIGDIRDDHITDITSKNWGVWKDFTDNLLKLKARVAEMAPDKSEQIAKNADGLLLRINQRKKSPRWKLRSSIGERLAWHELPVSR